MGSAPRALCSEVLHETAAERDLGPTAALARTQVRKMWLNQACVNRCWVLSVCVKKPKELHDVKDMLCALPGLCHLPGSLNPSFLAATWEK